MVQIYSPTQTTPRSLGLEMTRQDEAGSASAGGAVRVASGRDMQNLHAVSSMKGVIKMIREAIDRNAKTVIIVGQTVSNVSSTMKSQLPGGKMQMQLPAASRRRLKPYKVYLL